MRLPLPHNPVSLVGAIFATAGGVLFLIVFLLDLFGLHTNPYMGIVFFLILPAVFALGLILIPIGAWLDRRRQRAGRPVQWPRLDLNDSRHRTWAFFIVVMTLVNIVIVSLAAYSGVHYMDSVEFCGQVCHTVMEPEYAAYQDSPHSRVTCVGCHIGPGAPWFVRSKLSGTRQVFAVTLNTFSRPIPSPVHNLRPARETCEQCHWPEKFHGDKVKVIREYAEDEKNTESSTTLQIHVGGGSDRLGIATGIHWHMNLANEIEYIATDEKRLVIPWVRLKDRYGNVREYQVDGVTPEDLAKGERRRMDCVDCHNRPSHRFDATADKAVNRALSMSEMPSTLPFIKREATAALKATYPTQTAAADSIAARLREFYRLNYTDIYMGRRQEVERAVSGTQQLYRRNIFPSMNITWGTYANNIGHMDFPGCFRCHDDSHKTKDGKTIGQDCALCHSIQ
ncbi:MAG TPA: NapC/NirT family cytochrome c [Vicinamibacterales bacterium]|nr:NapC/NirT family cytochrome c [Vicinamibacterales bacterium]